MTPESIKAWRSGLDMSQPEAALALGVPVMSYRQWEQGRRAVPKLLTKACEAVTMARTAQEKPLQRKVPVSAPTAHRPAALSNRVVVSRLKKTK